MDTFSLGAYVGMQLLNFRHPCLQMLAYSSRRGSCEMSCYSPCRVPLSFSPPCTRRGFWECPVWRNWIPDILQKLGGLCEEVKLYHQTQGIIVRSCPPHVASSALVHWTFPSLCLCPCPSLSLEGERKHMEKLLQLELHRDLTKLG